MPVATRETVAPERIDVRRTTLRITGDSPLVVHAWAAKAKQMMLDKQTGRGKQAKEFKDPQRDYEEGRYRIDDTTDGFPSVGVKACAIRGAKALGMVMVDTRAAFHITGEFVPINGTPKPREDMVRVGMGTADIRYRPEYTEWSIDLPIVFNARAVSLEQIIAMLDAGGFGTGIGEYRPEKGGTWGRFHVDMANAA